jgi:hypothetical protein
MKRRILIRTLTYFKLFQHPFSAMFITVPGVRKSAAAGAAYTRLSSKSAETSPVGG